MSRRLPDPEGHNGDHQKAGKGVMQYYTTLFGEKPTKGASAAQNHGLEEQNLSDMLSDLAHHCDAHKLDFSDCIRRARNHYTEETGRKGTQFDGA